MTGKDAADRPLGVAGDAGRLMHLADEVLTERICIVFAYGESDNFRILQGRELEPSRLPEQFALALSGRIEPAQSELVPGSQYVTLDNHSKKFGVFAYAIS